MPQLSLILILLRPPCLAMDRPGIGPESESRCVGRTQSIEEAERVAQRYEMQGFEARIVRKSRAGIPLYEVWVSKAPDILSGKGPR
jgi:hypothetical protein